jgi:hypothetical protein
MQGEPCIHNNQIKNFNKRLDMINSSLKYSYSL